MARNPQNPRPAPPMADAGASPVALPPVLQSLMASPAPPRQAMGAGLAGAMPGVSDNPMAGQVAVSQPPSYQVGGQIGPDGQPVRPPGVQPGGAQGQVDPQMLEMQIQEMLQSNPQMVQQVQQAVQQAIMSGELTQQELNRLAQLAMTVLRSPDLYPQVRQFAIQQGIAAPEDIPEQYDQGIVIAVILAARAAQANTGGQDMMAGGVPAMAGQPAQSLKDGGRVEDDGSSPVMIEAHTGEYVIPKHVVEMKGREFFDRMLEQYAKNDEGGKNGNTDT